MTVGERVVLVFLLSWPLLTIALTSIPNWR